MKMQKLMEMIQSRIELSDKGLDAEVTLRLHAVDFMGSVNTISIQIDDVSNVWGKDHDEIEIDAIVSAKDINKLQQLKEQLIDEDEQIQQPPYSQEDYEKAKKQGFDLDDWNDYEKYFGLGEEPEQY